MLHSCRLKSFTGVPSCHYTILGSAIPLFGFRNIWIINSGARTSLHKLHFFPFGLFPWGIFPKLVFLGQRFEKFRGSCYPLTEYSLDRLGYVGTLQLLTGFPTIHSKNNVHLTSHNLIMMEGVTHFKTKQKRKQQHSL